MSLLNETCSTDFAMMNKQMIKKWISEISILLNMNQFVLQHLKVKTMPWMIIVKESRHYEGFQSTLTVYLSSPIHKNAKLTESTLQE